MINKIVHATIKYMALLIVFFLSIASLLSTQRIGVASLGEITNGAPIYNQPDSLLINLIIISIIFCISVILKQKSIVPHSRTVYVLQCLLVLVGTAFSVILFLDSTRTPVGDQMQVYSAALYFNQGDYINLSRGGYVSMYPQQLGYIAFMQSVFHLTGMATYQLMQLINCLFIGGILIGLFLCLNDLIEDNLFRMLGSIIIALSFPLYLLHSWVYGDIAFLLFTFLFLHTFYKNLNDNRSKNTIALAIFGSFMLIFRKNALILLLAAFLVSVVHGILKRDKKSLALGIVSIAIPLILWNAVTFHYQQKSGSDRLQGLPASCWIAMGMIEDASKPGWFNNYGVSTYYGNHCDYESTNTEATAKIAERLQYFASHPTDAASFWKRKICTQWNDPFFCTAELIAPGETASAPIATLLNENISNIRGFLSVTQSFVYLGFLFYLLLYKHNSLLTRLPEVIFLGGFLFSLLWEANSRYVYPYFLIIIPASILGWKLCIKRAETLRKDFIYEKNKH